MQKDKIELWIEENHGKYLFILAFLGFGLMTIFSHLAGNSKIIYIGFITSFLFILTDLLIHGGN